MASCWKSAQSCLGDTGTGGAFCGCGGCVIAPPASLISVPTSHHSDPILTPATRLSRVFLKHAHQPHAFAFELLMLITLLKCVLGTKSAPVSNILSTETPSLAAHYNGAPCLLAITLTFLIAFLFFFMTFIAIRHIMYLFVLYCPFPSLREDTLIYSLMDY